MLRLVRPRSYALALGLGLVASEVCIPLNQMCLHALSLYSVGLVSLASAQGPQYFGQKLDSVDGEERSERGMPETYLRVGKAQGYPRSYPTGSLTFVRDS